MKSKFRKLQYCTKVQNLFGSDPICHWMVWLYCHLSLLVYGALWLIIMVGFPLFLSIMLEQGTKYGVRVYLPRALFPPLGAWLGYKWFVSIVRVPHLLAERGLLESDTNFTTAPKYMNNLVSYSFAILATLYIAIVFYLFDKGFDMKFAGSYMLLLGDCIWWYFIIRTLQMAILVFLDYKTFFYNKKLAEGLNLFDYENAFGLKPLIEHTYRFLLLYILIIGSYLFYYQIFLDTNQNIKAWLSLVIWVIYFFFQIIGDAGKKIS